MNTTDTLQAYIEQFITQTQLDWQIQDAAERPWDVEWIFIFIAVFAAYITTCAIITEKTHPEPLKKEE